MTTVEKEQFWTQIIENPSLWGTIQTSDKTFNAQAENIWTVMNETFIKSGGLKEVNRWELMIGDRLEGSGEGTLNERKSRILKRITEHPPVSIKVLKGLIKKITDDDYIFDYDKKENKLTLEFHEDFENDIKDLIPRVIPVISDVVYNYNLPKGYLVAKFLECTGAQSISLGECPTYIGAKAVLAFNIKSGNRHILSTGSNEFIFFRATQWSDTSVCLAGSVNGKESSLWLAPQREASLTKIEVSQNWMMDGSWSAGRGDCGYGGVKNVFASQLEATSANLNLFTYNGGSYYFNGKLFEMQISKEANVYMDLVPVLDPAGIPCVFDKVSKKPFYNRSSVSFIVGMTMEQARKLSKLPAGGGSLTISLPNDYAGDMLITNAIADATSNGWTLTIQTYTPENSASEASTFGMPRIWVRKVQTENGSYVDNENNRYQVEWCVTMYTPDNSTPDQYGYEMFRNVESAIEYWGLSQWIDPEMENMLEQ